MMSNIDKDIHMLKSYAGMTHKLTDNQGRPKLDQAIENVLARLESYEKGIERLKINLKKITERDNEAIAEMVENRLKHNYVSKDKIRTQIEELTPYLFLENGSVPYKAQVEVLKYLLGE